MRSTVIPRLASFVLVSGLFFSPTFSAQIPERLKPCLPYPTLQDEIREMLRETGTAAEPQKTIVIEKIEFREEVKLLEEIRKEIINSIQAKEYDEDSNWIEDIQDQGRGVLQERGYFTAVARAEARLASQTNGTLRYLVILKIDEGWKYWTGKIRVENATAFPEGELRKLILLQPGDVFNVEKIRDGLEAMSKKYGALGYIDFTAEPVFDIDEKSRLVSLTVQVQEQKQFRLGKIEVYGLQPDLERILRSQLKPGEPFNYQVIEDFERKYKSRLPSGSSFWDMGLRRNVRMGTLDLTFDFRTCADFQPHF